MADKPDKNTELAWTRLLRAHHIALCSVEGALKKAGLPALSWYDVLLELERAGEQGMRPFELEKHLLLPQYGLSRLLDRIVKAGYIERHRHSEDGRGQIIVITSDGSKLRQRMWTTYAPALNAAIGGKLNEEETAHLARLLKKLTVQT